jgi:polyphosphate kinase 2 (PPK2 family)
MLEKLDLSKKIDKKTYKDTMKEQSERLGLLQRECKDAGIPVMIVFEGMGASGKGTQINRLIQALDPRGFDVYANDKSTEEERMRPFLWRFWTKLPAQGRIALFDRSWYRQVTTLRFEGKIPETALPEAFQDIQSFERQLTDDGMVIIKLFLYISKDEQKKRFNRLEASKENSWRVTEEDWRRNKEYGRFLEISEEMLQRTDMDCAPWTIIEGTDKDYRLRQNHHPGVRLLRGCPKARGS